MTQPGAFDVTFTVRQTSGVTEDVTLRTLAQNRDAAIMHATMWMMSMVDVAEVGQDLPTFTNFANDVEIAFHQARCPATLKSVRLELGIEEATSTLSDVLDDILK
jgi:beta-lactamase regulating signal transducer with metallopeptidase domain